MRRERLYISGPITGTTDAEERFRKAADMFKDRFDIVNPYEVFKTVGFLRQKEILDLCLSLLSECDYVYFMAGWQNSLGCQCEYGYSYGANQKGDITMMFE